MPSSSDKEKQRSRAYYEANKGRILAKRKEHYHNLDEVGLAELLIRRVAAGSSSFRVGKGRFNLRTRTPRWHSVEQAMLTYIAAAIMTELTGTEYVVDHLVPLNSPLVCGLHVHNNLCVTSRSQNRIKSNSFWPEMPCTDWHLYQELCIEQQEPFERAPCNESIPVRRSTRPRSRAAKPDT